MNNKLETIHNALPFFEKGSFFMNTPENHFEDPDSSIFVSVWGDQFKVEYSGPGELQEELFDTAEACTDHIRQWMSAVNS